MSTGDEYVRFRAFVHRQDAPRIRETFGDDVFEAGFVVSKCVPRGTVYLARPDLPSFLGPDTSGTVEPEVIKRLMERISRGLRLEVERYPEMYPEDVDG